MNKTEIKAGSGSERAPITTYHEKKIGKTVYRVTNVHTGEIDLSKTLENLIIRKVLVEENLALSLSN